jgi:hypothetical protein
MMSIGRKDLKAIVVDARTVLIERGICAIDGSGNPVVESIISFLSLTADDSLTIVDETDDGKTTFWPVVYFGIIAMKAGFKKMVLGDYDYQNEDGLLLKFKRHDEVKKTITYYDERVMDYVEVSIPDKCDGYPYFMVISNPHVGEAAMINLGTHYKDSDAEEYATEVVTKVRELFGGEDRKIYKVEGGQIRELDIHEDYEPPEPLLDKGQISWLVDERHNDR